MLPLLKKETKMNKFFAIVAVAAAPAAPAADGHTADDGHGHDEAAQKPAAKKH